MEININFSKKHFYTLLFFTVLMTTAIFVYAYGSSSPATFGHSAGEIVVNSTSIVDGSITGTDIKPNTLNESHMKANSLTGIVIDESSLGAVPIANDLICTNCIGTTEVSMALTCETRWTNVAGGTIYCSTGYTLTGMIGCILPSLESAPAQAIGSNYVTFYNSGACSGPNYIRCCKLA